jgi:hypothetical protein
MINALQPYIHTGFLNRSGWGSPNPILKPWPPRIQGQGPDSVIPRRPQTSGPNSSWADAGRQVQRNERPKGYEVKVCQDFPENLTIQPEMVYWFIMLSSISWLIFWVFECLWVFPTNATIFLCWHWISHIRPKPPRVTEFRGFHLHQALLPMTFLPLSKAVPQTSHLWMVFSTHLG